MLIDLENLPLETAVLHQLVRDMAAAAGVHEGEIARLRMIIRTLQRAQFGRRSERLDPDQLALALEEIEGDIAHIEASHPTVTKAEPEPPSRRKVLPDHLPREDVLLDVASPICTCCGSALHAIGESVSEMLDWVPAQLRVLRITARNTPAVFAKRLRRPPHRTD